MYGMLLLRHFQHACLERVFLFVLAGCLKFQVWVLAAGGPKTCALKVEDLPVEGNDVRTLMDMYSEVSIVEQFHGQLCISQLYDFGVTRDSLYMVMKEYKCSLLVRA